MLKKLTRPLVTEKDNWPVFHAVAVMLFILKEATYPMLTKGQLSLEDTVFKCLAVIMVTLYLYRMRLSGKTEIRLMLAYTAWVVISRFLNPQFYNEPDTEALFACVVACVALPLGFLFEPQQRRKLLNWLTLVWGGFMTLAAVASVYAALAGVIIDLPGIWASIGLADHGSYFALDLLAINHNSTSVWFYLALCLMVYQFFACENKLWRIPILLSSLPLGICIALSHCRTMMLVTAMSALMLLVLLVLRYVKNKKALLFILAGTAVAALAVVLIKNALSVNDGVLADSRDFAGDLGSLTKRTLLWNQVLPALKREPRLLLTGDMSFRVMLHINPYTGISPHAHLHNALLQTLMLTGVPGFLAVLALYVLLAVRMVTIFFSPDAPLHIKTLTIPLAGIMADSMFEVFLFTKANVRSLIFFILAGAFLAWYYELRPTKKPGAADSK